MGKHLGRHLTAQHLERIELLAEAEANCRCVTCLRRQARPPRVNAALNEQAHDLWRVQRPACRVEDVLRGKEPRELARLLQGDVHLGSPSNELLAQLNATSEAGVAKRRPTALLTLGWRGHLHRSHPFVERCLLLEARACAVENLRGHRVHQSVEVHIAILQRQRHASSEHSLDDRAQSSLVGVDGEAAFADHHPVEPRAKHDLIDACSSVGFHRCRRASEEKWRVGFGQAIRQALEPAPST